MWKATIDISEGTVIDRQTQFDNQIYILSLELLYHVLNVSYLVYWALLSNLARMLRFMRFKLPKNMNTTLETPLPLFSVYG